MEYEPDPVGLAFWEEQVPLTLGSWDLTRVAADIVGELVAVRAGCSSCSVGSSQSGVGAAGAGCYTDKPGADSLGVSSWGGGGNSGG